ncbi:hypothetical protein JCM10449v2_002643 [Rhodotorula kratochvilovae]
MPIKPYKRAHTSAPDTPSPAAQAQNASSTPSRLASLPKEVLARIARSLASGDADASPSPGSRLLPLASTCKQISHAVLPVVNESLYLKGASEVVEAVKLLKPKGGRKSKTDGAGEMGVREVKTLSIELPQLYSPQPAHSTLLSSVAALLSVCPPSLTALHLSLHSSGVLHPFSALFRAGTPPLTALASLGNLASFTLSGAFLWLHDLAPLLSAWPYLRRLSLASLRGDCTRPPSPGADRPRALTHLAIKDATLTGEMVAWLLDGQAALEEVELPLPGSEGVAWAALKKVVTRVEVLKVWDRWGKAAPASAPKKGKKASAVPAPAEEVDELASDAEDKEEAPALPPSPLLALVAHAPMLRVLLVTASLLPSAPDGASFAALLPHLPHLEELLVEDVPSSGLRKAVEAALETDALPALEQLVSLVKKGKGDAQKAKAFAKVCAKCGVKWEVREG